jgi:hypothetical protein
MSRPTPQTARDLLDSVDAPSVRDPLVGLVLYAALSVASLLALGVAMAVAAPHLDSPGLFVAAWCTGLPVAFALPRLLMRRLGSALVGDGR